MDLLGFVNRGNELFREDVSQNGKIITELISSSSFLVIGGAGTIGQAVAKEIFSRNPKKLDVVDINENNLVELVRDIRSSLGYIDGSFRTYAIDCASLEFNKLMDETERYDYILNLSALKHVRSEKDVFTLHRLIQVNIINTLKILDTAVQMESKKYFCVSTDKAANPVNMMGASKRIMEMFLMKRSSEICTSMSRFANVLFSDGSLLHGFNQRFIKEQPISAPKDVKRYFVTPKESGQLCLLSCLLGKNMEIFFPKLEENLDLISFDSLAIRFLESKGYSAHECESEEEARSKVKELKKQRKWPCYFSVSETTGEKESEEFYTDFEKLDLERFQKIGVVVESHNAKNEDLEVFLNDLNTLRKQNTWEKEKLINLFLNLLPNFNHEETGKYLDEKM